MLPLCSEVSVIVQGIGAVHLNWKWRPPRSHRYLTSYTLLLVLHSHHDHTFSLLTLSRRRSLCQRSTKCAIVMSFFRSQRHTSACNPLLTATVASLSFHLSKTKMPSEFVRGFFSRAVLKIAIVNMVGAALFGFGIGFVPIHTTFTTISQNCTLYESESACSAVTATTCVWGSYNNTPQCLFTEAVDCRTFTSESACGTASYCQWDFDDKVCTHTSGYSAAESGIFSGAMTVGGLLGSLVIGKIVNSIGRKKSMILLGVISVAGSALVHISTAARIYPLLVVARVIFGTAMGGLCCVAPMYVEEMVPDEYRKPVGVLFQVFCTFGIMLAALVGLLLDPTDFTVNVNMAARLQGFDAVVSILAVLVVIVGISMEESTKWLASSKGEESIQLVSQSSAYSSQQYSWGDMKFVLFVSFVLCVAQQMTGINAIMNYAPNITKSMNLKPLTGNFLVMAWNFVTTLVSIPLASRFSMRQMFLSGTIIASLSCLCTGIPVYPGVTSDSTRSALAGLGIAVFIAAFEIGMGPSFYVLAQILFPDNFRPNGSSFTMVTQFLFNIVINIFFPIAVEGLSGGASGDQNKGMGIAFMFFGSCGLLSWFVLVKYLQPFDVLARSMEAQ